MFFNNQQVDAHNRYTYDALYRLTEATGREHHSATDAPVQREPAQPTAQFPVTDQALRNYRQTYRYDVVGNIEQVRHIAQNGSWTRHYEYAPDSNRLLRTWQGSDEVNAVVYDYDTHGSMLNLNRTPEEYRLRWDHNDMIHHVNLGGGGQAFYNYASDKQRIRKRIARNGNTVEKGCIWTGRSATGGGRPAIWLKRSNLTTCLLTTKGSCSLKTYFRQTTPVST